MKTPKLKLLIGSLVVLAQCLSAQVKIDFNSTNVLPHLILKETGDDFARLYFENVNSTSGENWSIMGKVSTIDSSSRFRIFYDGMSSSGTPLTITGNLRVGIGTPDPPARLTIGQSLDQDDMGLRILNAAGSGSGRLWMNGNDFHVHAGSNSTNGFIIKSTGHIGAFTDSPGAKFEIYESNGNASDDLFLVGRKKIIDNVIYEWRVLEAKEDGDVYIRRLGVQEDAPTHQLDVNTTYSDDDPLRVRVQDVTKLRVLSNGGTLIGSGDDTAPVDGLHVEGQLHVGTNGAGTDRLQVRSEADENPLKVVVGNETKLRVLSNGGTSLGTNNESAPANGLYVLGDIKVGNGSDIELRDNSGTVSILLNADHSGKGRIKTDELEITGGSDISENFKVHSRISVDPGTLVSIDPEHPGQLCITSHAYDSKVVGVISGANGIATGLIMGQKGSIADGEYPVALTGRVYAKAEAYQDAIRPGDLLTSSDTPGHVMKVNSRKKGSGAIIGKALTSLASGQGEVLMLISLQ